METRIASPKGKEVIIGDNQPVAIIGERINPFANIRVKEGMISGNMDPVCEEAARQVETGADVLVLSTAAFGIDEIKVLPQVTEAVIKTVDVPVCLESRNPAAIENALKLGCGRPIISSVTGEDSVMDIILPLVKKYNTALVILASNASGIPGNAEKRLEILKYIAEKAKEKDIKPEDLIADCVAESSAVNNTAALVTLQTMESVKRSLGLNLVLGASNVSFGLPDRTVVNAVFLSIAIHSGLNSAIVNARLMKPYVMAADLLMGRDNRARRYTTYFRKLKSAAS